MPLFVPSPVSGRLSRKSTARLKLTSRYLFYRWPCTKVSAARVRKCVEIFRGLHASVLATRRLADPPEGAGNVQANPSLFLAARRRITISRSELRSGAGTALPFSRRTENLPFPAHYIWLIAEIDPRPVARSKSPRATSFLRLYRLLYLLMRL